MTVANLVVLMAANWAESSVVHSAARKADKLVVLWAAMMVAAMAGNSAVWMVEQKVANWAA